MDNFATEIKTVAFLYDLNKRDRIKYVDNIDRQKWHKWGKDKRRSFIEYLKKDYPVKPLLCYTVMEESVLVYYICDGFNRLRAIMKYLKETKDPVIMKKLLVLEIVPSDISQSDLNFIYKFCLSNK